MRFHVLTLFPEMILQAASVGVVGQAIKAGQIFLGASSPRDVTTNVHQTIDDRPFGGGDGMIMMPEPMAQSLAALTLKTDHRRTVIHLSPRGRLFTDQKARELSEFDELILVCSRYGGIDQRFLNNCVDEELSIGDYVLSGGELAALVVVDSIARLIPGVLGNDRSAHDESFSDPRRLRLEHPQFTRPRDWRGQAVPEALLSGHHAEIETWKRALSTLVTFIHRPDLVSDHDRAELSQALLFFRRLSEKERKVCGLNQDLETMISEFINRRDA